MALTAHQLELHGHQVSYRRAGDGPALLLLHGITDSSATWEGVAPSLAEHFTLIAPDLLGHGESATPRGDYSLGAHASGVRDILTALGIERVTVVGHSLGGGIAMQFAYQFPERTERLVLVSSGGLGREVHFAVARRDAPGRRLRSARPHLRRAHRRRAVASAACSSACGSPRARIIQVLAQGFASLDNAGSRQAFLHTVRAVIEPSGQRVSAQDRLSLAGLLPSLIVWGERDSIIPIEHGVAAHEAMPGSRFEVFPDAGHMPHDADPERFAELLIDFCATTDAAELDARPLASADDRRRLSGSPADGVALHAPRVRRRAQHPVGAA